MIYLDHASTTKINSESAELIKEFSLNNFYNISALYPPALKTRAMVEKARESIANILHTSKESLCFTSCATESNNWVILNSIKNKKGNIVISKGEHDSVYRPAMELKARGIEVREVNLTSSGHIDLDDLKNKVDKDTSLVSVIHCSNETGAINNILQVARIVKSKSNALVHSDGVQAFCKIDTRPQELLVDFYTISAHKITGPKGVGALYFNKKLNPLIFGGGQEGGIRSGTENTPGIVGFALAAEHFLKNQNKGLIKNIKNVFYSKLKQAGFTFVQNGNTLNKDNTNIEYSDWILSAAFKGIKSEILMNLLCDKGVIIGLGSACSSKKSFNRVLSAIGLDKSTTEGSIRLSFGLDLTLKQATEAADIIADTAIQLKNKLSFR